MGRIVQARGRQAPRPTERRDGLAADRGRQSRQSRGEARGGREAFGTSRRVSVRARTGRLWDSRKPIQGEWVGDVRVDGKRMV